MEVQPGLYVLASKLGWILTGRTNDDNDANSTSESIMLKLTYGTEIRKKVSLQVLTPLSQQNQIKMTSRILKPLESQITQRSIMMN
jgi:hypothetical protein